MKNIIFNQFLEHYVDGDIDLLTEDTYKIALLNSDYTAEAEDYSNFYSLQDRELEVFDENSRYEAGGKYIKFTKLSDEDPCDGVKQFTIPNKIVWDNMYIVDRGAYQAIIYRESDGLLVANYEFAEEIVPRNDDIVLDWRGVAVLTLDTEAIERKYLVDDGLDTMSDHSIQNRVVTETFRQMGVVFTDDNKGMPYVPDPEWGESLTFVTMIPTVKPEGSTTETIDEIFDEIMGD